MLGETLEKWVMDEVACAATLRGPDFTQRQLEDIREFMLRMGVGNRIGGQL